MNTKELEGFAENALEIVKKMSDESISFDKLSINSKSTVIGTNDYEIEIILEDILCDVKVEYGIADDYVDAILIKDERVLVGTSWRYSLDEEDVFWSVPDYTYDSDGKEHETTDVDRIVAVIKDLRKTIIESLPELINNGKLLKKD